jgi:hypothetical protein
MSHAQIRRLVTVAVLGLLWIGIGQDLLFQNVLIDLFAGGNVSLDTLFRDAINPASRALWVVCAGGYLTWYLRTDKARPKSAKEAQQNGTTWWWSIALTNVFMGWLLMVGYLWNAGLPASGWLTVLVFVILDVGLCFWVPTLVATPRTFRLVMPGAVKFFGDR